MPLHEIKIIIKYLILFLVQISFYLKNLFSSVVYAVYSIRSKIEINSLAFFHISNKLCTISFNHNLLSSCKFCCGFIFRYMCLTCIVSDILPKFINEIFNL